MLLHHFDLAAWSAWFASDPSVTKIEVTGDDGQVLFSEANVPVSAADRTRILFDPPLRAASLQLSIQHENLRSGGSIGIDNLLFSQAGNGTPGPTPLADPGTLIPERGNHGKRIAYEVTGTLDGGVWGTGIYTDDSDLSTAAVHAGILAPGATGIVNVVILPGLSSYEGSNRNGVSSRAGPSGFGSFRFEGGESAGQITFQPSEGKDTMAFEHDPTMDGSASEWINIFNSTCNDFTSHAFLEFDLNAFPAAGVTTKVELVLHQRIGKGNASYQIDPTTMDVHAVTEAWNDVELNWNTMPSVAVAPSASVEIPTPMAAGTVFEGPVVIDITELYKEWKTGTRPNFGLRYGRREAFCENTNENQVASSENPDPSLRPKLVFHTIQSRPSGEVPFAVVGIERNGGGMRLQFNTVPGQAYQVECSKSLLGPWQDMGAPIIATARSQFVDIPIPSEGQRMQFFRVRK